MERMNMLLTTVLLAVCIALCHGADKYLFKDSKNQTQAILQGSMSFKLNHTTMGQHMGIKIDVPSPKDVELTAVLYKKNNVLFAPASMMFSAANFSFNLSFGLHAENGGSGNWDLKSVTLSFNYTGPSMLYAEPSMMLAVNVSSVKSSQGRGFQCTIESFNLTSKEFNHTFAYLQVHSFQLQPFHFATSNQLSANPSLCTQDMADNKIVPIAVGAALGLLVIIVVIAYIIGRFRNRGKKSDYEVISS